MIFSRTCCKTFFFLLCSVACFGFAYPTYAFESLQHRAFLFDRSEEERLYFSQGNDVFRSDTFKEQLSAIAPDPAEGINWYVSTLSRSYDELYDRGNTVLFHNPRYPDKLYLLTITDNQDITVYRSLDSGKTFGRLSITGLPTLDPDKQNYLKIIPQARSIDREKLFIFITAYDDKTGLSRTYTFVSNDSGVSWDPVVLTDMGDDPITFAASDGVILYGNTGQKASDYLDPWILVTTEQESAGVCTSSLAVSHIQESRFRSRGELNLPDKLCPYALTVSPVDDGSWYILARDARGMQQLLVSTDSGSSWSIVDTSSIDSEITRFHVRPTGTIFLYTTEHIYTADARGRDITVFPQEDKLKGLLGVQESFGEQVQLYFEDSFVRDRMVAYARSTGALLLLNDDGGTWQSITPYYEAAWVGQVPATAARVRSGSRLDAEVVFRNMGNTVWEQQGYYRLGLYVYKDERYSTPPEYSDPNSLLFGQSYFADVLTWGASANGLVPNAKAAKLASSEVFPGEDGRFPFHFLVPEGTPANVATDIASTVYNDSYYREDLSLAYGASWMPNPTNGDPLGIAHVWFAIQVY